MIDEEILADRSAGVNIDSSLGVRIFGHETRQDRYFEKIELMGNTVNGYCPKARVSKNDLVEVSSRRVAVKRSQKVCLDIFSDNRDLLEEFGGDAVALFLALLIRHLIVALRIVESSVDLLFEVIENIFDRYGEAVLRVIDLVCAVTEISGIYDPEEILDKFPDFIFVGIAEQLNGIDILAAFVVFENKLYDIIDLCKAK